jgi:hypothetical protein
MKRALRLLAATLLAGAALSGCWLQPGYDAAHTRNNTFESSLTAAEVPLVHQAWSVDLLGRAGEPLVRGNRVYVAAAGFEENVARAKVQAFGTADGSLAWTRNFNGAGSDPFVWPLSFAGDQLWTGYFLLDASGPRPNGALAAPVRLDPADGTVVDPGTTRAGVTAPVAEGGRVAQVWINVSPPVRQLVVRDAATLATSWTATLDGAYEFLPGPAPSLSDGQIVVGDGTKLYAFPAAGCGASTCTPSWSVDLGAPPTAVVAPPGSPSVFVTRGTDLLAIDRATGATSWTAAQAVAPAGMAVTPDRVYVAVDRALATYATAGCGAAQCAPDYSFTLRSAASSAPVIAAGVVYVGELGLIQAFDTAFGQPLTDLPLGGASAVNLAVAGGKLYATTALPSRLVAFAPSSRSGGG